MKEAISFYSEILNFKVKDLKASSMDCVVDLINENAELQLSSLEGNQKLGIAINVRVDDVDSLFNKYIKRGLIIPNKEDSPVHQSPINQSWEMREFYVSDTDGNTLRFGTPIK